MWESDFVGLLRPAGGYKFNVVVDINVGIESVMYARRATCVRRRVATPLPRGPRRGAASSPASRRR